MLRQLSLFMVPLLLVGIPLYGVLKKQPVYELFVEGAAEGCKWRCRSFLICWPC
mgnify:CR=1 FL=1